MKSQKLTEGCRSRGSPVPRTTFYEQRSHHRAKTLLSQSQGGSSRALSMTASSASNDMATLDPYLPTLQMQDVVQNNIF